MTKCYCYLIAPLLLAAAVLLPGCAGTATGDGEYSERERARNEALVRGTIQYAVLRYIESEPDRAGDIASTFDTAIELTASEDITTLALLEAAVRERIDIASLAPRDQAMANTLITVIRAELEARIGRVLDAETVVRIVPVLEWVRDTAAQAATGDELQEAAGDAAAGPTRRSPPSWAYRPSAGAV